MYWSRYRKDCRGDNLHFVGLTGSNVQVTLEIYADRAEGLQENIVRTVTENCHTLKFKEHGFEKE